MQQGTISKLTDRGFGFIKRQGIEKDVFFHAKELVDIDFKDLRVGDSVKFHIAETPKGLCAVNVERI